MTGAAAITIEIKLFAWLTKHLPPGATGQRAPLAIAPGTTAADVIDQLRIPPKEAHLVLVNGIHYSPEERRTRVLKEGEVLAIWPLVAGG